MEEITFSMLRVVTVPGTLEVSAAAFCSTFLKFSVSFEGICPIDGEPMPVMAATHILALSKSTFLDESTPEAMQSRLSLQEADAPYP